MIFLIVLALLLPAYSLLAQGPVDIDLAPGALSSRGGPRYTEALGLLRQGKYFSSIPALQALRAFNPNDAEIDTSLALNYLKLGQRLLFRQAIEPSVTISDLLKSGTCWVASN